MRFPATEFRISTLFKWIQCSLWSFIRQLFKTLYCYYYHLQQHQHHCEEESPGLLHTFDNTTFPKKHKTAAFVTRRYRLDTSIDLQKSYNNSSHMEHNTKPMFKKYNICSRVLSR